MSAFVEIDVEWSRWERQVRKYSNMRFATLTAATFRTQEAMDEGQKIAERNIQEFVYDAYDPVWYQRTGLLGSAVQQRKGRGGIASGSIFISEAVLRGNPKQPEGSAAGKSYSLLVESGTDSPGPGHFAREFWRHTLQDLATLFLDVEAPRMLDDVVKAYEEA